MTDAAGRLSRFVEHLADCSMEQAIIYTYGLPGGGMLERHRLFAEDIRSAIAKALGPLARDTAEPQVSPGKPDESFNP